MSWTPERIETLTTLWMAGKSSQHIADCLGVSRGAVMGRVRKLGLTGQGGSKLVQLQADGRPMLDSKAEHDRDARDLDILAHIDAGWGLRETARKLGIDNSMVSRIAGEAKTREAAHV